MTRSSAREIAIHCSYSLGFSHESADEFLAVRLNKENFQRWSQESALYKEYPNEKQLQYIKELVRGVANHGPELDQYIAQYAKDWSFARIPLPAAAIMRVAMYEILYMPLPSTMLWKLQKNMRTGKWFRSSTVSWAHLFGLSFRNSSRTRNRPEQR